MANSQDICNGESASGSAMSFRGLEENARALLKVVTRGINRELAAYDLTPMDFAMMRLFLADHVWTATALAGALPVEVSAISRMAKKLVDRRLLSRRRSRSDRRIVFLQLTDAGLALSVELQDRIHAHEDRLTEGISAEDTGTFFAVIERILANSSAIEKS